MPFYSLFPATLPPKATPYMHLYILNFSQISLRVDLFSFIMLGWKWAFWRVSMAFSSRKFLLFLWSVFFLTLYISVTQFSSPPIFCLYYYTDFEPFLLISPISTPLLVLRGTLGFQLLSVFAVPFIRINLLIGSLLTLQAFRFQFF